jgi:mannose-6-phosphate isomerase-like protein (cupin superfamily)
MSGQAKSAGVSAPETFTEEGCFITELYNTASDPAVSVARARVEPGVVTALHVVTVEERYLIEQGAGLMTVGDDPPFQVQPGDLVRIPAGVAQRIENRSSADLIFLCVCTPRFELRVYTRLAPWRRER